MHIEQITNTKLCKLASANIPNDTKMLFYEEENLTSESDIHFSFGSLEEELRRLEFPSLSEKSPFSSGSNLLEKKQRTKSYNNFSNCLLRGTSQSPTKAQKAVNRQFTIRMKRLITMK